MGVPGGRAVFLTPSGRPVWQALDSPLWQATRDEQHEAAWEDFGPSNPMGSDGFTRLRTPGAASSRPRSAGSAMASLEAAKAAGEAARAAADAALAAAQLIAQEASSPVAASEPEIYISCEPSRSSESKELQRETSTSRDRSEEALRPASVLHDFLRSLAASEDLSALDRRMELAQAKPLLGETPGRWQQAPDCGIEPKESLEERRETLSSMDDFMRGLQQATEDFDLAVGASPAPSPPRPLAERTERRAAERPLVVPPKKFQREEYCIAPAPAAPATQTPQPTPLQTPQETGAVPNKRGERAASKSKRQGPTGNLAAMAAYVTTSPPPAPPTEPAPPAPAAARRPSGGCGVKLPPLPQKTREALEAAAMQPLYVKEAFKLLAKNLKRPPGAEELSASKALPALRSSSMPSLRSDLGAEKKPSRPTSDRGARGAQREAKAARLRSSRSTGSLG